MAIEAPTAPASSAPPAGVTIIQGAPPKPPSPPTTTIRASDMPPSDKLQPAKRGSARADMRAALEKLAGASPETTSPTKPSPETTAPKGEGSNADSAQPEPSPEAADKPGEKPPEPSPEGQPASEKPGKKNPWKLYESEKAARVKAESEAQELRARIPKEGDVAALTDRAAKAEKLAEELGNEIRYHNYERSPEFKAQFQEPYEKAFVSAMSELKEITLTDPDTKATRPINAEDLANLSFLPLPQAKKIATQLFGEFADDVMAARKEIRGLWDKRQGALEEWKGKGSQRAQDAAAAQAQASKQLAEAVRSTWNKINEQVLADPERAKFFKPKEGDAEWNGRLEKGFKLVDEVFGLVSFDAKLHKMPPEERSAAIEKLAAIRNRAAGWSALRHSNQALQKRIDELTAELKGYKSTTPGTGGTAPAQAPTGHLSARESIHAELRRRAG